MAKGSQSKGNQKRVMPADFRRRGTVRSPSYTNEDGHIHMQDENDKEDEGMDPEMMISYQSHMDQPMSSNNVTHTCQLPSFVSDPKTTKESSVINKMLTDKLRKTYYEL